MNANNFTYATFGLVIHNTDSDGKTHSHNYSITNGQLVISHALGYDRFHIISTGNASGGRKYNVRYYAGYHLDNNYLNTQAWVWQNGDDLGIVVMGGAQGLDGAQGPVGAQGETGLQGTDASDLAAQGSTGLQGTAGDDGAQGGFGNTGFQGTVGSGFQGATGTTGPTGAPGLAGSQGTQGADASDIAAQGVQGVAGSGGGGGGTSLALTIALAAAL